MTTISKEYRELNRKLHADNPHYGISGGENAPLVMNAYYSIGARTVLDYGSGKGTLAAVLRANGIECAEYDPAVEGKDAPPAPADIVYCGDVAEHVEPEYVDAFLDDLKRVTQGALLLIVSTRPATKFLEDGRNAHISLHQLEWWLPKLRERFTFKELVAGKSQFTFIGTPL